MAKELHQELSELLRSPREELDIEVKDWLDLRDANGRAGLAKVVIALANHGGGYVVIGFQDRDDGQFVPSSFYPENLNHFSQDIVQDAIQRFVEPPI